MRYGGQLGELARLARDTRGESEVRARDSIAAGDAIAQSAKSATPELQRIYDSSLGEMAKREGQLRQDLAGLGPAGDRYKAGGLFTSTTAANRTSGEKASALRELVGRRQDAVSGARFGAQQARDQGASEVSKIRDKILDVQAESGAFQAGRIGELKEGQRDRATTRRGQTLTARERQKDRELDKARLGETQRHNKAAEKNSAAKGGKKPLKLQSTEKHAATRSEIDRALQAAKGQKQNGYDRRTAGKFLTTDVPATEGEDGTKVPARKADSGLAATVALDLAYLGYISDGTRKRLNEQRFSVKTLGLGDKSAGNAKPKGLTPPPTGNRLDRVK